MKNKFIGGKKKILKKEFSVGMLIFFVVCSSFFVNATAYFQTYQPNVLSYYHRQGVDYTSFWPDLENRELCKDRQDFIINVRPGSCMPSVVRSDLLEEQNVPVFCKLDAIKLNPLIKVLEIKSVRIGGRYPREIAGVGFHPSRAAVRMYSTKIDNPFISDVGYIVIKLRKMPEKDMKDYVEANLTAVIKYDMEKAFGVGDSVFYLPLLDESEWKDNYVYYGFMNGKAYLRLDDINRDSARIFVYTDKNNIYRRIYLKEGETSDFIYLPGYYCSAGAKIKLADISVSKPRVLIEVDGVRQWVAEGESFLDGKCVVQNIVKRGDDNFVRIRCGGNIYTLSFGLAKKVRIEVNGETFDVDLGSKVGDEYVVYYGYWGKEGGGGSWKKFVVLSDDARSDVIENGAIRKDILDYFVSEFALKNGMEYGDYEQRIISKVAAKLGVDEKKVHVLELGSEKKFGSEKYKFVQPLVLEDKRWVDDVEKEFENAREIADEIVDYYGNEEYNGEVIGKEALKELEKLAGELGKLKTEKEIIDKLFEKDYLNKTEKDLYEKKLERLSTYDYSDASKYVKIGDEIHIVNLVDTIEPKKDEVNAEFYVKPSKKEKPFSREIGLDEYLYNTDDMKLKLKSLSEDEAILEYVYYDKEGERHVEEIPVKINKEVSIGKDNSKIDVTLLNINLKYVAKVFVDVGIPNAESETNFTVKIGIEKRAIKLSPEKTKEMIDRLNKSIDKWEKITNRLGNAVKAWKGACLATSTALTIKNFFENLGGKATARKMVMSGPGGWDEKCEKMVNEGKYKNMNECFSSNSDKIDSAVNKFNDAVKKINKEVEEATVTERKGIFGGVVDTRRTALNFANSYFIDFVKKNKDLKVSVGNEKKKLSEIFGGNVRDGNVENNIEEMINRGWIDVDDMRGIMLYGNLLSDKDAGDIAKKRFEKDVRELYERISMPLTAENLKGDVASIIGKEVSITIPQETRKIYVKDVVEIKNNDRIVDGDYVVIVSPAGNYVGKVLLIPVKQISQSTYSYDSNGKIYAIDSRAVEIVEDGRDLFKFLGSGVFEKISKDTCENRYVNPEVRFFETQPYKGLPELVPLDINKGWYVAVKPSTSFFSKSKAYTEAGMLSSFWICNVGENGLEEFNKYGDDMCTRVDVMSGQPIDQIYCLSSSEARNMVRKAMRVVERVAAQYGNKMINVPGVGTFPGKSARISEERQCQDFMSPRDCNILFNVCDPVICPPSRCDLGGRYRVDDVVQSGIIGSLLLCLPNFGNPNEGGVLVPVCLSGLYAGLDSYVSVLKAHRDCLQENLKSGRYIGICDEIYSIYLCEFFWRQAAPLLRVGIPKLIEYVYYGSKARGGGEYAVINDAWKNMENSFNYFTNYYGKNAFDIFRKGSTSEVGTEICKAFVSTRYPASKDIIEQMMEPESPVQFYARFDEIPFTDATAPPTSHYKVYYHIYAGRDEGVYYSVYLKMPTEAISYYGLQQPTRVVDTGYIGKGRMIDKTEDFTAPAGYKELCVRINSKEYCGFGQVTTDFAINYLRDLYVESEMKRKINSEEECVSGGFNAYGLINPNLEEGVSNSIGGASKIGVTRVCATHPPGGKTYTNSSRWVAVGYCDKEKGIICWADTESVKQAIQGIGIQNKTLLELRNEADKMFEEIRKKIGVINEEEAKTLLEKLEKMKNTIITQIDQAGANQIDVQSIEGFEREIKEFMNKAPLNNYKAQALKLKFDVYVKLCEKKSEGVVKSKSFPNNGANSERSKEKTKKQKPSSKVEKTSKKKSVELSEYDFINSVRKTLKEELGGVIIIKKDNGDILWFKNILSKPKKIGCIEDHELNLNSYISNILEEKGISPNIIKQKINQYMNKNDECEKGQEIKVEPTIIKKKEFSKKYEEYKPLLIQKCAPYTRLYILLTKGAPIGPYYLNVFIVNVNGTNVYKKIGDKNYYPYISFKTSNLKKAYVEAPVSLARGAFKRDIRIGTYKYGSGLKSGMITLYSNYKKDPNLKYLDGLRINNKIFGEAYDTLSAGWFTTWFTKRALPLTLRKNGTETCEPEISYINYYTDYLREYDEKGYKEAKKEIYIWAASSAAAAMSDYLLLPRLASWRASRTAKIAREIETAKEMEKFGKITKFPEEIKSLNLLDRL